MDGHIPSLGCELCAIKLLALEDVCPRVSPKDKRNNGVDKQMSDKSWQNYIAQTDATHR